VPNFFNYIFLFIFSYTPTSKSQLIYGLPGLDPFMFLPLLNVPELLETYGVIEFYWFTTDPLGHILGPNLYAASIRRFDRYFGYLVKRLKLDRDIVLESEEKIRYLFEGEDVFGYYNSGYNGEWLTDLDWPAHTRESKFPAVPPNIYNLLLNKRAGDIVIVINPPKIPIFYLRYPTNHARLTDTDLMIPILLKGPQLEHLYEREEMWNFGFRAMTMISTEAGLNMTFTALI